MRPVLGVAASICGALFIGYCIYFDRKRRSHPDFRRNLRLRRMADKGSKSNINLHSNHIDPSVQDAFMNEINLGQTLLMNGDFEGGIEHLARGVLISNRPIQLIQIFQQVLPYNLSTMLMTRVQAMQARMFFRHDLPTAEDVVDRSSLD